MGRVRKGCSRHRAGARIEREANRAGQVVEAIWLAEQGYAIIQTPFVEDDVPRVTRCENDSRSMRRLTGKLRQFAAADRAGHDDIGEKQVDGGGSLQKPSCVESTL